MSGKKESKIKIEVMNIMKPFSSKKFSNTNVEEVKRLNAQSGMSYNEVKQLLGLKYRKNIK
jgi:hypothetical protein